MTPFTRYQKFLSISLLCTGIINSVCAMWANIYWRGSHPNSRYFTYPFTMMWVMFFGEILCLIVFKVLRPSSVQPRKRYESSAGEDPPIIRESQNFNPLLCLPSAVLDILAAALLQMNYETKLSYAADCRVWRGLEVLLVAYLSKKYVGRTMEKKHRRGVEIIFIGFIVIVLGYGKGSESRDNFILLSQIVLACQMVYQEKYVVSKDIPPLQAVGWEGVFGFFLLSILLIPIHYAGLENVIEALSKMPQSPIALTVIAINYAFFNFAGLSIAKELSAAHRIVLDSLRSVWSPLVLGVALEMTGACIVMRGIMYFYNITLAQRKKEQSTENDTVTELEDILV